MLTSPHSQQEQIQGERKKNLVANYSGGSVSFRGDVKHDTVFLHRANHFRPLFTSKLPVARSLI